MDFHGVRLSPKRPMKVINVSSKIWPKQRWPKISKQWIFMVSGYRPKDPWRLSMCPEKSGPKNKDNPNFQSNGFSWCPAIAQKTHEGYQCVRQNPAQRTKITQTFKTMDFHGVRLSPKRPMKVINVSGKIRLKDNTKFNHCLRIDQLK